MHGEVAVSFASVAALFDEGRRIAPGRRVVQPAEGTYSS